MTSQTMPKNRKGHFAIIEARFYQDINTLLLEGVHGVLKDYPVEITHFHVPGVLDIPPVLAMAAHARRYDAFILLGCVIRGKTSHYDIVSKESIRACLDYATQHRLAIGQGILTAETRAQAQERADPAGRNKGAAAATAALCLLGIDHMLKESL